MNRLLLVATLVAFALPSVAAAEDAVSSADSTQLSGTWVNGVKLGLTYSMLSGDTNDGASIHTGTTLGYFFSYRLGNGLAIQPEIMITERGSENVIFNESGRDADLTYSYIDIPVVARYNLAIGNGLTPYGYGGPNFSINIDSNRRVATNSRDWDANTSGFDVGFAAGIGLDYLVNNGVGATLDMRFTMGFLSTDASEADSSLTNRQFVVMLGIWK